MSAVGVLITSTLSIAPEARPLTSCERESGFALAVRVPSIITLVNSGDRPRTAMASTADPPYSSTMPGMRWRNDPMSPLATLP